MEGGRSQRQNEACLRGRMFSTRSTLGSLLVACCGLLFDFAACVRLSDDGAELGSSSADKLAKSLGIGSDVRNGLEYRNSDDALAEEKQETSAPAASLVHSRGGLHRGPAPDAARHVPSLVQTPAVGENEGLNVAERGGLFMVNDKEEVPKNRGSAVNSLQQGSTSAEETADHRGRYDNHGEHQDGRTDHIVHVYTDDAEHEYDYDYSGAYLHEYHFEDVDYDRHEEFYGEPHHNDVRIQDHIDHGLVFRPLGVPDHHDDHHDDRDGADHVVVHHEDHSDGIGAHATLVVHHEGNRHDGAAARSSRFGFDDDHVQHHQRLDHRVFDYDYRVVTIDYDYDYYYLDGDEDYLLYDYDTAADEAVETARHDYLHRDQRWSYAAHLPPPFR